VTVLGNPEKLPLPVLCEVCLDGKGFAARPCPGCGRQKRTDAAGQPITEPEYGTMADHRYLQKQMRQGRHRWVEGHLVPENECDDRNT
jgi:hypothetical protein